MRCVSNNRILLIDVNKVSRLNITSALKDASFTVITAGTFARGRAKMLRVDPDLIILSEDFGLTKRLSILDRLIHLTEAPLIVVGTDKSEVTSLLLAGADAYMMKPVNIGELLARIRSLLRRAKVHVHPREDSDSKML